MDPVEINDPEKIQEILKGVTLSGEGFVTGCLLEDVWDAGLTYPDYFRAGGEDPTASLNGVSPAWETYHLSPLHEVKIGFLHLGRDSLPDLSPDDQMQGDMHKRVDHLPVDFERTGRILSGIVPDLRKLRVHLKDFRNIPFLP